MLVLKGCIKKSKTFTGGAVMKVKAKPSLTDTKALQKTMNYEVPHSFLQPHSTESAKKTHDGITNFTQHDNALHSLNFHGRKKEKKEVSSWPSSGIVVVV
jgi:hypothetical protein